MTPEDEETWRRAILRYRSKKNQFFRDDHESPLEPGERASFNGLHYFEPDPTFRFTTGLQRLSVLESVMMVTSKGTRQLFNNVGYFDLVHSRQPFLVHAFQPAEKDSGSIFVPFRDMTSGDESYGAARYLDMEVEHDDMYTVDFNYAYNPFCAYSEGYVCPLPPKENWLSVAIRAGEKSYRKD